MSAMAVAARPMSPPLRAGRVLLGEQRDERADLLRVALGVGVFDQMLDLQRGLLALLVRTVAQILDHILRQTQHTHGDSRSRPALAG
jgi:hypothetical protein